MHSHGVAVKVGIEGATDQRMHANSAALNKHGAKRLYAEPVQSRRAVQNHIFAFNDIFKYRPDLRDAFFNQARRSANVVSELLLQNPSNDKRTKHLKSHELRQSALVKRKLRTDHNHRTARIIHSFAQKILAKEPALAFEIIRKRFEGASLGGAHSGVGGIAVPLGAVNESVHRFLKNSFFIS